MPPEVCTHPWRFHVEPFRVAGNLYYVGNSNVSAHLIDTGAGLILLDTGFPQTVYLLLESVRRLGFDPRDIAYILNCHGHYDHLGGTRAIVDLTGAETFLGEGDIEILTRRPELSWAPEYGVEFYEAFDVDHPLRGGEVISLGRTSIEVVHTPGHTPGTMSYFFEVIEGGRACTVGIHGGPGINTLSDDYLRQYGLPAGRRLDYMRSLERLKRKQVDIFIGAHPDQNQTLRKRELMSAEVNPFVDPQAWPQFLEARAQAARDELGIA